MIVIPNEKLLAVAKDAGFFQSFRIADDVLRQGVQGISDIITIPGIINRDFADVKTTMAGMGHAVMGTAIRSGENRAVEAAQAAMASPLLEAGAIDGARGILINITGSSKLRLSEVNAASSLIQTSAHEDANIIFGAVLDEKMADEVKITVIATGFRDQMPARRARMLDVENIPVVSVPVMAAEGWMQEGGPGVKVSAPPVIEFVPPAPPPAPRFLSEDEEPEPSRPAAQRGMVAQGPAAFDDSYVETEPKQVAAAARPKFAEMEEEPVYTPLPRDYASETGNGVHASGAVEEQRPQPAAALFAEAAANAERDLDVPAFMRRVQF
jgi:cell division protein FtsZ